MTEDHSFPWLTLFLWFLVFLLFLLLLAALPWFLRTEQRRRRWASVTGGGAATAAVAEVAWVELRDSAVDLGYSWPEARTPRQTGAVLAEDGWLNEAASRSLREITALVENARYSAAGGGTVDAAGVRTTVEEVVTALGVSGGKSERTRARLAPRSLKSSLFRPTAAKARARARGAVRRVTRRPA